MKNSNSKASLDIYKKNKRIFIPIDNQKYIFVIVAIIYEFSYTETKSQPNYSCLNFFPIWLLISVSKWKVCNTLLHLQDFQQVNLTWPTNNIFHYQVNCHSYSLMWAGTCICLTPNNWPQVGTSIYIMNHRELLILVGPEAEH